MTEDVVAWFNQHTGQNLTPIFNPVLRHAQIPRLELLFGITHGSVMYKWSVDEDNFAMPVRVGTPDTGRSSTHHDWQTMQTQLSKEDFQVATDQY